MEAGPLAAEVIVFLHGIPDAWYQWYHQIGRYVQKVSLHCTGLEGLRLV